MRASRAATTTNGRPHLVYPALLDGHSLRTGQLPDDSSDELLLVQLSMNGETHLLSLLPDDPSVSDDFFVRTVFSDDEELRCAPRWPPSLASRRPPACSRSSSTSLRETTLERCFYRGTVNRDAASFVSVSLCGSRQHLHGFYLYKGTRYAISPLNPKDDQGRNDGIKCARTLPAGPPL